MSNTIDFCETECKTENSGGKCNNKSHLNRVKDLITQNVFSDEDICSYINCHRPITFFSGNKSTPLHLAASCGRLKLVKWLVRCRGAAMNIASKLHEKYTTPLALSLAHGHLEVAISLISLGAEMTAVERDLLNEIRETLRNQQKSNRTKMKKKIPKDESVWHDSSSNGFHDDPFLSLDTDDSSDSQPSAPFNVGEARRPSRVHRNRVLNASRDIMDLGEFVPVHVNRAVRNNNILERSESLHTRCTFASDRGRGTVSPPARDLSERDDEDTEDEEDKGGDVYVCGPNKNYTIGYFGSIYPKLLEDFHRSYPTIIIKSIHLNEFHGVLLSVCGRVFSCGHGQGGRLGHGSEISLVNYEEIKLATNERVYDVATSRDHTVFLLESGEVYSCGLNNFGVLGVVTQTPLPTQILTPTRVRRFSRKGLNVIGVSCTRYYTLVWNKKEIFVWGYNGGQMGFGQQEGATITTPHRVQFNMRENDEIELVAATTGATIVLTSKGDVYCFDNFQIRKIFSITPGVRQIIATGGKCLSDKYTIKEDDGELTVVYVDDTNKLWYWQACMYKFGTYGQQLVTENVMYVAFCGKDVFYTTKDGKVYRLLFKVNMELVLKALPSAYNFDRFFTRRHILLPKIHNAKFIAGDPKGENMAFIVENPLRGMPYAILLPASCIADDFMNFMSASSLNDNLHDIKIKTTDGTVYAAHKYILARGSKIFRDLLLVERDCILINKTNPLIFKRLLQFIYCKTFDLSKPGPVPEELLKLCPTTPTMEQGLRDEGLNEKLMYIDQVQRNTNYTDPLYMLRTAAEKYRVYGVNEILSHLIIVNGVIHRIARNEIPLNPEDFDFRMLWDDFPEYHDIELQTADDRIIKAHKCILRARSNFFAPFCENTWPSLKKKNGIDVYAFEYNYDVVELALHYMYTDEVPKLYSLDVNTLCTLLKFADYYHMVRLIDLCTHSLATHLTFKNCCQILQFSYWYSDSLRRYCLEFICHHLEVFLDNQYLEGLDETLLAELAKYYRTWNPKVLPSPLEETLPADFCKIKAFAEKHPVDVESDIDGFYPVAARNPPSKGQRRRTRSHKKSTSEPKNADPNLSDLFANFLPRFEDNGPHVTSPNYRFASSNLECCATPNNLQSEPLSDSSPSTSSNPPTRLTAILSAQEAMRQEGTENQATTQQLGANDEFPELGRQRSAKAHAAKSPQSKEKAPHLKAVKLSQRQRKLQMEAEENAQDAPSSPKTPPKNPWKICDTTSPSSPEVVQIDFNKIISNEKKHKENIQKMKSKLLAYTVMEDKALEELSRFYNAADVNDEIITIERVQIELIPDTPVWVQKSK